MTTRGPRVTAAAGAALGWLMLDVPMAFAQIVQSDVDSDPGSVQVTQLVTSNAEVRKAVAGLVSVAAISLLVFGVYWYLTGRAARQRYAREFGGRHASAEAVALTLVADPVPEEHGEYPWFEPAPPHSVGRRATWSEVERRAQKASQTKPRRVDVVAEAAADPPPGPSVEAPSRSNAAGATASELAR